jgi:hypothetical protein
MPFPANLSLLPTMWVGFSAPPPWRVALFIAGKRSLYVWLAFSGYFAF